jgi:hypothetical protein
MNPFDALIVPAEPAAARPGPGLPPAGPSGSVPAGPMTSDPKAGADFRPPTASKGRPFRRDLPAFA